MRATSLYSDAPSRAKAEPESHTERCCTPWDSSHRALRRRRNGDRASCRPSGVSFHWVECSPDFGRERGGERMRVAALARDVSPHDGNGPIARLSHTIKSKSTSHHTAGAGATGRAETGWVGHVSRASIDTGRRRLAGGAGRKRGRRDLFESCPAPTPLCVNCQAPTTCRAPIRSQLPPSWESAALGPLSQGHIREVVVRSHRAGVNKGEAGLGGVG